MQTIRAGPLDIARQDLWERVLLFLLAVTGFIGLAGGLFLAFDPTGSALSATVSALRGTPLSDWRVPGVLLGVLVGLGDLGAFGWVLGRAPLRRPVGVLYAAGLFAFELVKWIAIGAQALERVFAVVGLAVVSLATTLHIWPARTDDPRAPGADEDEAMGGAPDGAAGSWGSHGSEIEGLPEGARRYFAASISEGAPLARSARLRMRGSIKLGPGRVPLPRLRFGVAWAQTPAARAAHTIDSAQPRPAALRETSGPEALATGNKPRTLQSIPPAPPT